MGKRGFAHGAGKQFFRFSSVSAFKQTKEHILPQVPLLKMFFFFFANFLGYRQSF